MPPRAGTPGEPFGWRLCDQVRNAGAAGVQVLELARQPAVIQALKHGGVGAAYSTHTYAMMFLAGLLQEYRPLAEDWRRIRRLARSLDHATSPARPCVCACVRTAGRCSEAGVHSHLLDALIRTCIEHWNSTNSRRHVCALLGAAMGMGFLHTPFPGLL